MYPRMNSLPVPKDQVLLLTYDEDDQEPPESGATIDVDDDATAGCTSGG